MNTSSYSPVASGTYNRWRVEFVLKRKMTYTINKTQAMAELYITRLGDFHFYTYYSGFLYAFICLSFILMAVDIRRRQQGYAVHMF